MGQPDGWWWYPRAGGYVPHWYIWTDGVGSADQLFRIEISIGKKKTKNRKSDERRQKNVFSPDYKLRNRIAPAETACRDGARIIYLHNITFDLKYYISFLSRGRFRGPTSENNSRVTRSKTRSRTHSHIHSYGYGRAARTTHTHLTRAHTIYRARRPAGPRRCIGIQVLPVAHHYCGIIIKRVLITARTPVAGRTVRTDGRDHGRGATRVEIKINE